jgi:hypothetical protein
MQDYLHALYLFYNSYFTKVSYKIYCTYIKLVMNKK